MKLIRNKNTPKVVDGIVQKKNNHKLTPNYWNTPQKVPQIDKENPGKGYKHFLTKKDILSFIDMLPDWNELSTGLDAILLSSASGSTEGWYNLGIIGVCAWPKEQWEKYNVEYFMEHKEILERLEVPYQKIDGVYLCKFTVKKIKAYQLLHILLHELGHHHDRMNTKSQQRSARGENYAELYSLKYEEKIWTDYIDLFGI